MNSNAPSPLRSSRKRKAIDKDRAETPPKKGRRGVSSPAVVTAEDNAIASYEDLPFMLLKQVAVHLTYDELCIMRLVNKRSSEAALLSLRCVPEIYVIPLLRHYFPHLMSQDHAFDSLYGVNRELRRLLSHMNTDLVTKIDFNGLSTFNRSQLAYTFNNTPLPSVVTLSLSGMAISPKTWKYLSFLFPEVKTLECTPSIVSFPESVTLANPPPPAMDSFEGQRQLQATGLLDSDRLKPIQYIKKLFPNAIKFNLV